MSSPDLFVVCKNCGSEVSPYVTECPYCGSRVRKRAPKLERDDRDAEPRPRQRRTRVPTLPRLRPAEIEGIAPETRPTATLVLIGISLVISVVLAANQGDVQQVGGLLSPFEDDVWRYFTTAFVHNSLAYQFVTLIAVGVFGTLLERRFGWFAPVLVFVLAGAAGAAATMAIGPVGGTSVLRDLFPGQGVLALGANGAALGLLCAWLVDDRRAARAGDDRGNDLIGVLVFAAVLVLIPLAVTEADPVAGIVGGAAGALMGLVLRFVPAGR